MNELLDPKFYYSLSALIIAIATLPPAIKRLTKSINKIVPEGAMGKMANFSRQALKYIIEETTPPTPPASSSAVNKAGRVLFAALFYVLMMDCICLLIIDVILIACSDANVLRKLLGAGVVSIIVLAGRFCLTQAEKLRVELKATSRVLW